MYIYIDIIYIYIIYMLKTFENNLRLLESPASSPKECWKPGGLAPVRVAVTPVALVVLVWVAVTLVALLVNVLVVAVLLVMVMIVAV